LVRGPGASAFNLWTAPEEDFHVEYVPEVLETLRVLATEALMALGHGGLEVGGVLLGHASPGSVRITGYRSFPVSHVHGPAFRLSEEEQTELAAIADPARGTADDGSSPVGFYVSHTRADLALLDRDREVFDRCFPQPWSVLLILKPAAFDPTSVAIWYRNYARNLAGGAPAFELTPLGRRTTHAADREIVPETVAASVPTPEVTESSEAQVPLPPLERRRRAVPRGWLLTASGAVAGVVLGVFV
jgi:hypothetical protein